MTSTHDWTRVVVLTPPAPTGRGLTEGLKKEFASRDWFAIEQQEPHLAMAELCLRERAQIARSAWGMQRMEQIALVILQPEYWNDLNDLIEAVHQFVPSASIWSVDGEQSIQPLNGAGVTGARPAARRSVPGKLKTPETDAFEPIRTMSELPAPPPRATLSQAISREEIDMLLEMESSQMSAGEDRS